MEILVGHGKHAAEKIAQVVSKVGIDALDQAALIKTGVRAKMHFAQ